MKANMPHYSNTQYIFFLIGNKTFIEKLNIMFTIVNTQTRNRYNTTQTLSIFINKFYLFFK